MANGTNFKGANTRYRPPEGVSEEQCHTLSVFKNGKCIVACWEISDGEIIELIRTRKIFTSVWSGNTLYPMAVGAESLMRPLVADFGPVWTPENKEQPNTWFDAAKATIDKLSKAEQFSLASQVAELLGYSLIADKQDTPLYDYNEENCTGHVGWLTEPKICKKCGVHIDSLRPPDD